MKSYCCKSREVQSQQIEFQEIPFPFFKNFLFSIHILMTAAKRRASSGAAINSANEQHYQQQNEQQQYQQQQQQQLQHHQQQPQTLRDCSVKLPLDILKCKCDSALEAKSRTKEEETEKAKN